MIIGHRRVPNDHRHIEKRRRLCWHRNGALSRQRTFRLRSGWVSFEGTAAGRKVRRDRADGFGRLEYRVTNPLWLEPNKMQKNRPRSGEIDQGVGHILNRKQNGWRRTRVHESPVDRQRRRCFDHGLAFLLMQQ